MEAERIEEESIRVNQSNIAMQIDEARKLKEKHGRQAKLKEILDQGRANTPNDRFIHSLYQLLHC